MKSDESGMCRWRYEVNLYRNMDQLWRAIKVFNWIVAGFVLLVQVIDGFGISLSGLREAVFNYAIGFAFILISYYLYAFLQGGRRAWDFAMDERGVEINLASSILLRVKVVDGIMQFLAAFSTIHGLLRRFPAHNAISVEFDKVCKVQADRKKNAINVYVGHRRHQVFVSDDDFDFVLNHIAMRINRCV